MTDTVPWHANHTTLVETAQALLDDGTLTTGQDVVDFFEKPWKWDDEYQALHTVTAALEEDSLS